MHVERGKREMKMRRLLILAFALSLMMYHSVCYGLKFYWARESIGTIETKEGKVGTGFVVGNNRQVVTCAHVAVGSDYYYVPDYDKSVPQVKRKSFPIKLSYSFPRYDLSVLTANEDITQNPLQLGEFRRIRPGDLISYVGWDSKTNKLQKRDAYVLAKGEAVNDVLNNIAVVDFIEFEGVGKPGWSGGPVFNSEGKVVALMREAWTKKGIKGGNDYLMNRAFSTNMLNILMKELLVKPKNGK